MTLTIPKEVRKEAKVALAIWADKIVASAEDNVPQKTGALHNSIGWVWGNKAPKGAMVIGSVNSDDPDLTITVFAGDDEAFYARLIEFGSRTRAAHPYFFPAYRLQKKGGKSRLTRAIKKGIKKGVR
ncbi:MAG: HK97 gp10 family phage protein [Gammaproteobacteria bacterium]|nr:HK97 gp10 family phage protein [Gammaproteobacteria bacterium]